MTPLIRKELRDQRPFLLLGLFFFVLELLDDAIAINPVRQTLATTFERKFGGDGDLSVLTFIIALALGTGLLVREQDDRTLEFLEGLPVTRARIFAVKVLVALGVTLAYPVLDTLYLFLCHALAATSLDRSAHLELLAMGIWLRVAQALFFLALALVLSHFRRLSWLLLGVLFSAYFLLRDRLPRLALINPFTLTEPRFQGRGWLVPAEALAVQLPVTCALLGLSLAIFTGAGERLLRAVEGKSRGALLGGLIWAATLGVCAFAVVHVMDGREGASASPAGTKPSFTFTDSPPAHAQTVHYRFTYASNQSKRAERLAERADALHERVRGFLGVEAGEPIEVDLTGSERNTVGKARGSTIRMALVADLDAEDAITLAHETTHVLARRLAGGDAEGAYAQFRTFHEGLATYVEYRFFQPHEPRASHEFVAAAMWARHEVKLEELMSVELLGKNRDPDLMYTLGLLWVDALVKRYGDGAPARLLTAIGRPDAPEGLEDAARWQDCFQAAGFDLSAVADTFYAALGRLARTHAAELATLPRPRGALEPAGDAVELRPVLDSAIPEGWVPVCRFRAFKDSPRAQIDGPFDLLKGYRRERSRIANKQLWYQVGIRSGYGRILYEPWVSAPVE